MSYPVVVVVFGVYFAFRRFLCFFWGRGEIMYVSERMYLNPEALNYKGRTVSVHYHLNCVLILLQAERLCHFSPLCQQHFWA